MYRFSLITVGSLKEHYWRDAEQEYLKRLTPYVKFGVHEIKEEAFKHPSEKDRIIRFEGEKVLKKIPDDAWCILLDREGKHVSSEVFADVLRGEGERGQHIFLLLADPWGFLKKYESERIKCSLFLI